MTDGSGPTTWSIAEEMPTVWAHPLTRARRALFTYQKEEFYEKFGFKVYGVMEKNFPLKQYCLIREVQ